MTIFENKDVVLEVSRIDSVGWWLGNTEEHVAKGTALGTDFTENIYTPSVEGMIGKYDRHTDCWEEIENQALKEYWNQHGDGFVIGKPNGTFPSWAIKQGPPEYDPEIQTILFVDGKWKMFPILIGESYWNDEAMELTVSDYNFVLPEKHTFNEPLAPHKGHVIRLIENEWKQIKDYRNREIYNKSDCLDASLVEDIGEIKQGYTLSMPSTEFDTWVDGAWETNLTRQHQAAVASVESIRKSLYQNVVDPLVAEANIKRLLNNEENAKALEVKALSERQRIQEEYPWPEPL